MFCPGCGSEERQVSQYCRVCGADLRAVRVSLEKPDAITASAAVARDEIGRAIAERIRDLETAGDLKQVAEDVLPQIEKFLESPQERRLRTVRQGVVTSTVGLGASLFLLIWGFNEKEMLVFMGLGITTFLIGLGFVINALFFTVPKQSAQPPILASGPIRQLGQPAHRITDRQLTTAEPLATPPSVTEQTTHRLGEKDLGEKDLGSRI